MTAKNRPQSSSVSEDEKKTAARQKPQEGMRETIEAIAIAFILAFVFKTFEAEAFVIPTGSMAPTLYGRHKEVTCMGCHLPYTIGASQEIDQETGILMRRIEDSVCPNCRFPNKVKDAPVFNGDRIVVNKQVRGYNRFDVVVFKNPEEPHVNYIKRLVGLPGETIRIRQGDIQARRADSEPWKTQRKDPYRQNDIQLLVYDDRFPAKELLETIAEERWAPAAWNAEDSAAGGWPATQNAWQPDREARTYTADASDDQMHWLRYRHLIPSEEQWAGVRSGYRNTPAVEPALITDFCGFNADDSQYEQGLFWVNDLTLEMTVSLTSSTADGTLILELEEGIRTTQCRINTSSGQADIVVTTREPGLEEQTSTVATVDTGIAGSGDYDIAFANVDDRLSLWVDGDLIPLGDVAEFQSEGMNLPTRRDLCPVGIAAKGLNGTVSSLRIRRDIYYRNDILSFRPEEGISRDPQMGAYWTKEIESGLGDLAASVRSPEEYARIYADRFSQQNEEEGQFEFRLADDEYLMFGDNSPASKDSRLFDYYSRPLRNIHSSRYAVREQDLIGEALCIFWPHGIPFLNGGRGFTVFNHKAYTYGNRVEVDRTYPLYTAPFYPNLSRMKIIR